MGLAEMDGPQAASLPGGRMHFQHGPIDLILKAEGPDAAQAFQAAWQRFRTVLEELVAELPVLRSEADPAYRFAGTVAQRMRAAVIPHLPVFITPMAAVAGSVADEVLAAMLAGNSLSKAWVNNGGDIAFHLADGETADAALLSGLPAHIRVGSADPVRGMATSGWRGRSHSLGIADSVTVLAENAAMADAAATLIANAIDLPGHAAISRAPAESLSSDSDLGERMVTLGVGKLDARETAHALDRGHAFAETRIASGLAIAAILVLNGQSRICGSPAQLQDGVLTHA